MNEDRQEVTREEFDDLNNRVDEVVKMIDALGDWIAAEYKIVNNAEIITALTETRDDLIHDARSKMREVKREYGQYRIRVTGTSAPSREARND